VEDRKDVGQALEHIAALVVLHLADRQGPAFTTVLALSMLDSEGPARLTALAAAAGVSQPSMSQLVQRLEQQSLAARVGDPGGAAAS
jgi:DNA-binding MarR family transcriptional regulator